MCRSLGGAGCGIGLIILNRGCLLSVVGRRHALAREELALSSAVCRLPTVATTASERSLRTARILCCSYFLVATSHQSSSIDTILNGNLTGKKEFITSCLSLSKRIMYT